VVISGFVMLFCEANAAIRVLAEMHDGVGIRHNFSVADKQSISVDPA